MKDVSSRYVVFYDVDDRRAWLVNGASAVLHLVRASLEDNRESVIGNKLLFKAEHLKRPESYYTTRSAVDILTEQENMELKIFPHKRAHARETASGTFAQPGRVNKVTETHVLFQDRVEQVIHFLEQVWTYQSDRFKRQGVDVKIKPRSYLDGFDFMEVATGADPTTLRTTELQSTSRTWVDFTRAIHAVTLFGNGFGELIGPARDGSSPCSFWKRIPKEQDYLAVCVNDLRAIVRKWGSLRKSPIRVVGDIYWHSPGKLFDACSCTGPGQRPCDRAQMLLPKHSLRSLISRPIPPGMCDWKDKAQGAVIFGHSRDLPMTWPDESDKPPEEDAVGTEDVSMDDQDSESFNSQDILEAGSPGPGRSTSRLSSNQESSAGTSTEGTTPDVISEQSDASRGRFNRYPHGLKPQRK